MEGEIGENDGEMKEERVSEERRKKCSSDGEKEDNQCLPNLLLR